MVHMHGIYQDCFRCVHPTVPPRDINVSAEATAFVDNTFIASCCASAYPKPVIRINEVAVPIVYGNHTDGVYQGCASRSILTSGVVAGSNLTTNCSVSLYRRITYREMFVEFGKEYRTRCARQDGQMERVKYCIRRRQEAV